MDKTKENYIFVLLLGVVIYISDDTILFGTNVSAGYLIFKHLVYLFVTFWLLIGVNIKIFKSNGIYFLCAIVSSIIFTCLLHFDFTGGYAYQILIVFLAYLVTRFLVFESFLSLFKKYMFVLCVLSIFVFVIANYYDWMLVYFPVSENSSGVEFYNLYVGSVYKDVAETRNASIFREPGVFMIYILLAITFELFLAEKVSFKFLSVMFIALFTTFSTAAFVVLFFLIAGYLLKIDPEKLKKSKIFIVVAGLVITLIFWFQPDLYTKIFSKLSSESDSFGSSIARVASVVVNLEIFASNPVFGSGLTEYGGLFEKYSILHFNEALEASGQSTNSFMSVFATYGLLYGVIILYALMRFAKKIAHRFVLQGNLFLILLLMFSSQDMRYSLLLYMLVFYGLNTSLPTISRFAQNKNSSIN